MHVGKAFDKWLMGAEYVELWASNMLTASQCRIFILPWVGEAAKKIDIEMGVDYRMQAPVREDWPGDNRRRKP